MAPTLHPQQILAGYEIETLLGKGGMGEVYRARQLNLDRLVALKILPPDIAERDPDYARRFVEEAQAAGGLNHPNIIAVYNVGKAPLPDAAPGDAEVNFFAMEYVDGKSVREIMERKPALPQTVIDRIMVGMTKALMYAESRGIVHRDIKPDNIMVTTEGAVKLADLGLALRVNDNEDAEQVSEKVMGTPLYMSPEQARGLTIDTRSDQYSLGATLYHMLTGKPPFIGKNTKEIMRGHVCDPVPDPKALNPTISDDWRRICMTLLAKKPDERYANCQALRTAITKALKGPDTPQVKPSVPDHSRPGRSPHRRKTAKRPAVVRNFFIGVGAMAALALIVYRGPWNSEQPSNVTENTSPETSNLPLSEPDTEQVNTALLPEAQTTHISAASESESESEPQITHAEPVTQFSITRVRNTNSDHLRARTRRQGDLTEVIYGTADNPWYVQDFIGENMTITKDGLNWQSFENIKGGSIVKDTPRLIWRQLVRPPLSVTAEIAIKPGTVGLCFGLQMSDDDELSGSFFQAETGTGKHRTKARFSINSDLIKKDSFSEEKNYRKIINKGEDFFHTLEVRVDADNVAMFFLNGDLFYKRKMLNRENGEITAGFLLKNIRGNDGLNSVTIRTLKFSGVLLENVMWGMSP